MRNQTIDVARGIGILLVVLGHNWLIAYDHASLAFRMVFSFHMPLFFFLSGLFIGREGISHSFLLRRADALLKPFFVVLSVWGVGRILFQHLPWQPYLLGMLYATGFTIDWTPLWFLPHLFLCMVLLAGWTELTGTLAYRRAIWWGTLPILLIAGWYAVQHIGEWGAGWRPAFLTGLPFYDAGVFPGLPWSADLLGISAAFVLAAGLLRDEVLGTRFHAGWLCASLLVFCGLHWTFSESLDLHMRQAGAWYIVIPEAAAGIVMTLQTAALLARFALPAQWLAYLGKYSLIILLFHTWFEWKVFRLLSTHGLPDLSAALVSLLAGVLCPMLIVWLSLRCRLLGRLLLPLSLQK